MKKKPEVPALLPSAAELAHVDDGQFSGRFRDDLMRLVRRYYNDADAAGCMKRSEILGVLAMVTFDVQIEWDRADRRR